MKKLLGIVLLAGCLLWQNPAKAQAQEIEQLTLNIKKLDQLRQILRNMYDGYRILTDGYKTVKDITEGNFHLHDVFLKELLAVNPHVRDYHKVAQILGMQQQILSEYRRAYRQYVASGQFSPDELRYLTEVYRGLFDQSLRNLDELTSVITAGELRMNDGERLRAIDRIHEEMLEMRTFLYGFNTRVSALSLKRESQKHDLDETKNLYDTP